MIPGWIHPVVWRELSRPIHRKHVYFSRMAVAAAGSFIAVLGLGSEGFKGLHIFLFLTGGLFAAWKTLTLAVGAFSDERRNGTLGLLFLSGLSVWQIFLMKLGGSLIGVFINLIGILPFQAFPFLGPGLSPELFVTTVAALVLLPVLIFAAGAFGSALSSEDSSAWFLSLVTIGTITLLPLILVFGSTQFPGARQVSTDLLLFCPGYLVVIVFDQMESYPASDAFYASLATMGWIGGLLLITLLVLRNSWKDEPKALTFDLIHRWLAVKLGWTYDSGKGTHSRWLDEAPAVWLILRDRSVVVAMWALFVVLISVGALFCFLWGVAWVTPGVIYLFAVVVVFGLSWLYVYTCGRRIGDDRRSGVLEMLLTTCLSPAEFIDGQRRGVDLLFHSTVRASLVVLFTVSLASVIGKELSFRSGLVFLMAWVCLAGFFQAQRAEVAPFVMWISLNSGRSTYAVWKYYWTQGAGFVWLVLQFEALSKFALGFPSGSTMEYIVFGTGSFILILMRAKIGIKRRKVIEMRLEREFRSIAAEPLPERSDRRFKGWDPFRRFSERA